MIKTDWVAVCSHPMEFFCRLCSSLYRNVKNEYKFFYVGCKTKLVCQPRSVVALPSTYLAVCQPRPVVSLPSTYLAVCQPRPVVSLPSTYLAVCQPRSVVSLPSTYLAVCQPRPVVSLPSTYLAVCQPRPVVSLPSTYLAYLNFFHKNFVLTVQLFQISAAAVVDSSTFLAGAHRSYDVRAVAYQNIRYKLDGSKVI